MKKAFAFLLAAMLLMSTLAACGGEGGSATVPPAEVSAAAVAPEPDKGAGVYTFTESGENGEVLYTVELKDGGGFVITVSSPAAGETVYTGADYEWSGSYFTTGVPDGDALPGAGWFNPDGSCIWLVGDEARVTPMNYVEPGRVTAYKKLPYADDSSAQVLDVYLPEEEGTYPVILVFHGGGFAFGDQGMAIIQPIFAATEQGYAVVSVDYRKSSEAPFPAAVADAKAAVRWVRANAETYGFDPDRIAVWGESAGAYLAVMTALTPDVEELNGGVDQNLEYSSAVRALVSFYAPVDFWELDADAVALGMSPSFGGEGSFESNFVGQAVGEDEEFTRRTWWGSYTDRLPEDFSLAAWVQVGDSDHRVPYLQSLNLAEELSAVIGEDKVSFGIIEGADHEDALFYTQENLSAVYAFLDEVMK